MLGYAVKRLSIAVPVLFVISFLVFFLVELPPGDFETAYCSEGKTAPPPCPAR